MKILIHQKLQKNDLLNNGNDNADSHLDNIAVNEVLAVNNVIVDNPVLSEEKLKMIYLSQFLNQIMRQ